MINEKQLNTSLNQIPAIVKKYKTDLETKYCCVLNYGCGRYWTNVQRYLNVPTMVYDKNIECVDQREVFRHINADVAIVCANVLNVITDTQELYGVIEDLLSFKCDVYISIYEGNKSGEPSETQRNERTHLYMNRINLIIDGDENWTVRKSGNNILIKRWYNE